MTNFSPYGIPYNHKAAGMPPTYLDNIPMTATRQPHPDFHDEAMPYRPRERSMEKAFRQLCCGSCWGFCAWIAGILVLLTGFIVLAVVLVSKSKHAAGAVPLTSSNSPAQLTSLTAISSPVTSIITITASSEQPSISITTSTVSQSRPSTVTDTVSQMTTSTITSAQTTTATSTVSPSQVLTVTMSLSGSVTTSTTTSISTASGDSISRKTSLLQSVNSLLTAKQVESQCFQDYLSAFEPGLYTAQSYTTIGTWGMHSTSDGIPTREARVTDTGLVLGATTTLWPYCGMSTLSSYSVAQTTVPPTKGSTITSTSIIMTTLLLQEQNTLLHTSKKTPAPLTEGNTVLQALPHSDVRALHREAHNTMSNASGLRPVPVFPEPAISTTDPVTYVQTLNVGSKTRRETVTFNPGILPYTSTPRWQRTSKRDAILPRHTPNSVTGEGGGHSASGTTKPAACTCVPITYIQTLAVESITQMETVTYTPGILPYTTTPSWQRKPRTQSQSSAHIPRHAPSNTHTTHPITYIRTLALLSTMRMETVIHTSGILPYTSTPTWPHHRTRKQDALPQEPPSLPTAIPGTAGSSTSVSVGSAVICGLDPGQCPTLTSSTLTSLQLGPPITASAGPSSSVSATAFLPSVIFSSILTSSTQTLPPLGTVASPSLLAPSPPTSVTQPLSARSRSQNQHMNTFPKRSLNAGIIVGIVLASLVVVIAVVGAAHRWFRYGYL